jgi:hypothetical protein
VTLPAAQRRELLDILDRIDNGLPSPEIPGHVGRFLRQYAQGRTDLDRVLVARDLKRREDDAVSGIALSAINAQLLGDPQIEFHSRRLGEVAEAIVVSEELGCVAQLVMWLNALTAKSTLETLRRHRAARLDGDYRWTPPSRITPGEAKITSPPQHTAGWCDSRILKVVSDDIDRHPHALEYVRDRRPGYFGLKVFRSVCARHEGQTWEVLPALGSKLSLRVASERTHARSAIETGGLAMLLISREPWADAWTIVEAAEITPDDALAHVITWADFQRELHGLPMDTEIVSGLRVTLRAAGVRADRFGEPNLTRSLLPAARDILRQVRGI